MRVRLNAFHKDSSASYSKPVKVNSREDLEEKMKDFDAEVPFSRWYYEHECLSDVGDGVCDAKFEQWMKEIEDKIGL